MAEPNFFERIFGRRRSEDGPTRVVDIRHERGPHEKHISNRVITSKYTPITFIPYNLLNQFRKGPNIYFLVLGVLQMVPQISTTNGIPTLALPLTLVVVVAMIKDGVEDYRRHVSDREENATKTRVIPRDWKPERPPREGEDLSLDALPPKQWHEVELGDVIIVGNREMFPSDMILLASSDQYGIAYIETANLDGETNLKLKQAHSSTSDYFGHSAKEAWDVAGKVEGQIECQPPNKFLHQFEGTLQIQGHERVSLSVTQLLLRGCKLRNTEWVMGVAVYTGHQSKIQMNSTRPRPKESRVGRETNLLTLIIFGMQMALCLSAGIAAGFLEANPENRARAYLQLEDSNPAFNAFLRFLTFILIFTNFIPISLLVTLGLVKGAQGRIIGLDKDMYHERTKSYAVVRSSDLNEELGQIDYVFTDKTGTLTKNVMQFRKCCVGGRVYGKGTTEIRRNLLKKMGKDVPPDPLPGPSEPKTPNVNFVDSDLRRHLRTTRHPNHQNLLNFFMHLAINHSVMPEHDSLGNVIYSASSPDEGALTYGAKHFGFVFQQRDPTGVMIEVLGTQVRVEVLLTIEFTSSRKRSSVVCRLSPASGAQRGEAPGPSHPSGGPPSQAEAPAQGSKLMLFCKGADNVISERLLPAEKAGQKTSSQRATIFQAMEEFAEDGLRTLCIAGKELKEDEWNSWFREYTAATLLMDGRVEKMNELYEELEQDLELRGCTGVEDKLQDDVGETLESLALAGIKVWMLTGDKVETAINIGIATSLVGHHMRRIVLDHSELEGRGETVGQRLRAEVEAYLQLPENDRPPLCLVIDGHCLHDALEPEHEAAFLSCGLMCQSVICCRVSPEQKGSVVKLVRRKQKQVTLAIGDGANDCAMIQEADVGVGLRGEEGLQAFNVSDYGIAEFRHLKILLLVHGRWCYRRISKLILYMFYKNIVLVMPQYFLGFVSLFSGQKLYYEYMYQLYNVCFTSLPALVFGTLDQDVSKRDSLKFPQLYSLGHDRYYFNVTLWIQMIGNGIWHAMWVWAVPFWTFGGTSITHPDGKPTDLWTLGSVTYLLIVIVVNIKLLLETYYLTWLTHLTTVCSFVAWFFFQSIFSSVVIVDTIGSELLGSLQRLFASPLFYVSVFLASVGALTRDVVWKAFKRAFIPEIYHVVQQLRLEDEKKKKFKGEESKASAVPKQRVVKESSDGRGEASQASPGAMGSPPRGFAYTGPDPLTYAVVRSQTQGDVPDLAVEQQTVWRPGDEESPPMRLIGQALTSPAALTPGSPATMGGDGPPTIGGVGMTRSSPHAQGRGSRVDSDVVKR
uniref:Phospholipid-transporting ATPase n=1 Tax=Chromera velia CCMP2878 TaxID=1169474 RepID=A0A0G4GZW6_9ALVE|eukprot:Cvel_24079.t1-p1 / transcript=Cvel_24079.t1 / gene=Cvel_24079 / organism=Chromera_velia_CCMP2878 / gene_product=Probable phospholipid-transporting ATPase IB, putative / transcript_product=Probable phospholipid-transporting ATPase IB, putative / location=Cvel_scaffold2564:4204-19847(+) / protein_length=1301 / sequence_SO=supercontig / SO=protein_coding / is_pseudo=false